MHTLTPGECFFTSDLSMAGDVNSDGGVAGCSDYTCGDNGSTADCCGSAEGSGCSSLSPAAKDTPTRSSMA